MDTTNNFKRIMAEDELLFPPPPDLEDNVYGSLQVLSIMGQAMELYVPKVFEMFILTLGGTIKEIDDAKKDPYSGSFMNDPDDILPGIAGFNPDTPPSVH